MISIFLQMLKEVGFQAGQHEVLAESFAKEISKNIHDQAKQLRDIRRKNMKESEKLVSELNSAYKAMQTSKEKFRKSYEDQEKASGAYAKADADGNVSRNEIEKLRNSAQNKTAVCDSMKHTFADQLVKTNAFRQRYYYELLPGVLDELQALEHKRIELIRHGILSCVAKERQVSQEIILLSSILTTLYVDQIFMLIGGFCQFRQFRRFRFIPSILSNVDFNRLC